MNPLEKKIERIANEISFKLLATVSHPDHEWLKLTLTELIKDEINEFFIETENKKTNVLD